MTNRNNEIRLEDFDSSAPPKREKRCKRLGRGATKEEVQEAHRFKMAFKALRRKGYEATGKGLPIRQNRSKRWNGIDEDYN